MTEKEKTIGAELKRIVARLNEMGLLLLLVYGQGLADGHAVRDQPDGGSGRRRGTERSGGFIAP